MNDVTKVDASQVASGKSIDELIAGVPKAYSTAHDLVQKAAVAIVQHAMTYGDCSRALTLTRAIPINQARAIITYFMTVSPIGVLLSKNKKDDKVRLIKATSTAFNNFDMDKARALSWWTMDADKAEKEAIEVHSGGVFDAVLKSLEAIIENKGKAKDYQVDAIATATALKNEVMSFRAKHLAAVAATNVANASGEAPVTELPVGRAAA